MIVLYSDKFVKMKNRKKEKKNHIGELKDGMARPKRPKCTKIHMKNEMDENTGLLIDEGAIWMCAHEKFRCYPFI